MLFDNNMFVKIYISTDNRFIINKLNNNHKSLIINSINFFNKFIDEKNETIIYTFWVMNDDDNSYNDKISKIIIENKYNIHIDYSKNLKHYIDKILQIIN